MQCQSEASSDEWNRGTRAKPGEVRPGETHFDRESWIHRESPERLGGSCASAALGRGKRWLVHGGKP